MTVTISERIVRRKLGAFEVLIGLFVLELIIGSAWHSGLYLLLALVFYLTKDEFGGEFSLLDVSNLFGSKESKE